MFLWPLFFYIFFQQFGECRRKVSILILVQNQQNLQLNLGERSNDDLNRIDEAVMAELAKREGGMEIQLIPWAMEGIKAEPNEGNGQDENNNRQVGLESLLCLLIRL
jgi:hypothetical protein